MRILSAVHPTDNQKRVLAKIAGAATPKLAAEAITGNQNLLAARDILAKLGVISFTPDGASLTDKGSQVAQEENITDASGQLTDIGQELSQDNNADPQANQQNPQEPMGDTQVEPGSDVSLESFSFLRELLTS